MEFRLTYSGPLKAAAGIKEKHQLRYYFHQQFKVLWNQIPLNERADLLESPPKKKNNICIITKLGGFNFAPLVCERLHLICELSITLLRPEAPGSVITQGGDIDNRLKTLFDSLRMPKHINEIPSNLSPTDVDNPYFCLLEDDSLITKVNVTTDRLLQEKPEQNDVMLVIHVTTKAVKAIWGNLGLG
jgi:hypothetical protein